MKIYSGKKKGDCKCLSRTLLQSYLQIKEINNTFAKQFMKFNKMKSIYKNNKIKFLILVLALVCVVSLGFFLQGCSQEDDEYLPLKNSSLEITDFKKWFYSQNVENEFIEKQEPNWYNAEIKYMQDGKTPIVSIEVYRGMNVLGNDSIIELQVAYVGNNFRGSVKVLSFFNKENADVKYYSLTGQLLEKDLYYAPNQQYMLIERYVVEVPQVRLKSDSECDDYVVPNSATPIYNSNGSLNSAAYNCHQYVWGDPKPTDPHYNPGLPHWNYDPNISGSGYTQVTTPQVGDIWVSYGYAEGFGDHTPIHSAYITQVTNGQVTQVTAKCGSNEK